MQQRDITVPQVATGAGYSFLYSLYLHCGAWLLRKAVAFLTGDGSSFTKHLFVDTPGLGEGRVRCSICLPSNDERRPKLLPLILVMEGGGFVLGQPSDGERNDRYLSEKVCYC
jgi:acetyl esterase